MDLAGEGSVQQTGEGSAPERSVHGQPGLAVTGATLHGVGIAACIATAAARIAAHLAAVGEMMRA